MERALNRTDEILVDILIKKFQTTLSFGMDWAKWNLSSATTSTLHANPGRT